MVGLIVNATVSSTSNNFPSVTATGSGVTAPGDSDWSVSDYGAPSGDMVVIDIDAQQTPVSDNPGAGTATTGNYQLDYFEVAIEEDGAAEAVVERLYWGPWTNRRRPLFTTTAQTAQRMRVRNVQRLKNEFSWNSGYTPQVGDAIAKGTATAEVASTNGGEWVVMTNINDPDGDFEITVGGRSDLTIAGNAGTLESDFFPAHLSADRVEVRSEWSNPKTVTPTVSTPTVTISASKTSIVLGEAVRLEATPSGFQTDHPMHDCDFQWTVAKAGEQGSFTAIGSASTSKFEDEFGSGQNNRCEGNASFWCFQPQTLTSSGTITITINVWDREGNNASATQDITVVAPVSNFAAADTYVVSATSRSVPGGTGSENFYTTIESLVAALPSTGEALILIDTTGSTTAASDPTFYDINDLVPDRLVILPYSDAGVGVAAGARTTTNYGFRYNGADFAICGFDLVADFDASDPYSISSRQPTGVHIEGVTGNASISDCKLQGWDTCVLLPSSSAASMSFFDVDIYDWNNFGAHGGDTCAQVFAGCHAHHNPAAYQNDGKAGQDNEDTAYPGDGFFIDHPGVRSSRPTGNRAFSKTVFSCYVGHSNFPNTQPAVRFFGDAGNEPVITYVSETIFDSGTTVDMGCTSGAFSNFDGVNDMILDRVVMQVSRQHAGFTSSAVAPLTMRQVKGVWPDMAGSVNGTGAGNFHTFGNKGSAAQNWPQNDVTSQRIRFEFCTAVCLHDFAKVDVEDEWFRFARAGAGYVTDWSVNISFANNLIYVPQANIDPTIYIHLTDFGTGNDPTAVTEYSGGEETTSNVNTTNRYTPNYPGHYVWDNTITDYATLSGAERLAAQSPDLSGALPAAITATFEPTSGADAYRSATGSAPRFDILGRQRAATTSKGAYCPDGT